MCVRPIVVGVGGHRHSPGCFGTIGDERLLTRICEKPAARPRRDLRPVRLQPLVVAARVRAGRGRAISSGSVTSSMMKCGSFITGLHGPDARLSPVYLVLEAAEPRVGAD